MAATVPSVELPSTKMSSVHFPISGVRATMSSMFPRSFLHGTTTLQGHITPAGRQMMRGLARGGDGAVQYPALFEWARWMGDLPLGDPRVRETLPQLTPQPLRPLTERVDMRGFHALRVPCTYIRCLRDAAVVPARAAEYAARLGVTPIDLDCAHNPMLSAVDELAKILTKLP